MDYKKLNPSFIQLCKELSGMSIISNRHLYSMHTRLSCFYGLEKVNDLVDCFVLHGLEKLKAMPQFEISQQLNYCLYTGELLAEQKQNNNLMIDPVEDYFEGLLWKVIQAHPKGISGGYYGYWQYPPEDMINE